MKKIIFVLAAVLLVCASAGCITVEDNNETKPDRYYDERYISSGVLYIYVDEQTGVEYLVGVHNYVTGICPRYNADGTLKINEEFRK